MAVQNEETDKLTLWRADQFLGIGFGDDDAFMLAEAKGKDGFPLYWGYVKKLLEQGATKEQVVAIYKQE